MNSYDFIIKNKKSGKYRILNNSAQGPMADRFDIETTDIDKATRISHSMLNNLILSSRISVNICDFIQYKEEIKKFRKLKLEKLNKLIEP